MKTEKTLLADMRKDILGVMQRAMTVKQVESTIWKLWAFVRDNKDSLDSERCCKKIQDLVNGAVEAVTKRAEALAVELDTTQQELRDSHKEVKRLTSELETSLQENVSLKAKISELTPDNEAENHPDAA